MDVSVKLCQAVKDGLYDGKSFYRLGTPSVEGSIPRVEDWTHQLGWLKPT